MNLPNAENAQIDRRKLADYCLNPEHPRGKHKARVFAEVLSLGRADAAELEEEIRGRILAEPCVIGASDSFGTQYNVDFRGERDGRKAAVRTSWIVRASEDFPRLTTCFIL